MENIYKIKIYEKYNDLIKASKNIKDLDNNDLWKIFEWFTCIRLSQEHKRTFLEYDDIEPDFKEKNNMSRNDTGIDACDLNDTIVQCKLRKDTLTLKDCATFFASQNVYDEQLDKTVVKWNKLIVARNADCKLSENLAYKRKLFVDKTFSGKELIDYCEELIKNPPKYPVSKKQKFILRDYQIECIDLIKNNKKNIIINIPTGTGKNVIIINSLLENKKYLILVPRIILMEQLRDEIIIHRPSMKNNINLIGDNNNKYDENKNITICVFNSVKLLEKHFEKFEKIVVDESHHINKAEIYEIEEDETETHDENNEEIIENDEDISSDAEDEISEDINKEEILEDDKEDELKETNTYIKIIRALQKYNNNVYLSATIDQDDNFLYYSKDIREMINKKYLRIHFEELSQYHSIL